MLGKFTAAYLAIFLILVGGCSLIRDDLRYPGGFTGRALDKHMIDAKESKQLALLRATIIMAMAARMSNATIQNPDEAGSVASYLASTADEINYAAGDLYGEPCRIGKELGAASASDSPQTQMSQAVSAASAFADDARASATDAKVALSAAQQAANDAMGYRNEVAKALASGTPLAQASAAPTEAAESVPACGELDNRYYVNFESEMPFIEGRIIRLMMATLPQNKIKSFASDVQGGNVLGGAFDALKIFFVGFKGLHAGMGAYRSGEEAIAANLRKGDNPEKCKYPPHDDKLLFDETKDTVYQAVQCLGFSHDDLFNPAENKLPASDLPHEISEPTFQAMFLIARTSCVRLPLGTADQKWDAIVTTSEERAKNCKRIRFNPQPRPDRVVPLKKAPG